LARKINKNIKRDNKFFKSADEINKRILDILMKALNYGKGYKIYPDKDKNLLPAKLKGKKYL